MGAVPSREAHNTLYSLRYGSHEVALIPLTRQFFGPREADDGHAKDDDTVLPSSLSSAHGSHSHSRSSCAGNNYRELKRQLVRVRNDPSIRYNHMHSSDCSMFEIPPATYTEEHLERFIDIIDASLFDTNAELLEACMEHHPTPMMAQRRKMDRTHPLSADDERPSQTCRAATEKNGCAVEAGAAPTNNGLAAPSSTSDGSAPTQARARTDNGEVVKELSSSAGRRSSNALSTSSSAQPMTGLVSALSANEIKSRNELPGADSESERHGIPSVPSPRAQTEAGQGSASSNTRGFVQQTNFRPIEGDDLLFDAEDHWNSLSPEWLQACVRFKRAVRPLPCAVVFLYISGREEINSFSFCNRKMNVIGYFGCRTHESEADDVVPYLQVRKAILKAAGDRTLERVMTLGTKCYLEQFTEMVTRYQSERAAPSAPLSTAAHQLMTVLETCSPLGLLSHVLARASMVVTTQWNNYPVLKFLYEAAAFVWSKPELQAKDDPLCLETYQKPNGEKGLILQFNGNLLARAWLWVVRLLRPAQRRNNWAQFTLDEHAQQKDQEVAQWLASHADAQLFMAGEVFTTFLVDHLDRLHTEIVRARETPQDDSTLWMANPELSHDGKLYRIFNSPYCGPFLTTVKGFKDAQAAAGVRQEAADDAVAEKKKRKGNRKDRPAPAPNGANVGHGHSGPQQYGRDVDVQAHLGNLHGVAGSSGGAGDGGGGGGVGSAGRGVLLGAAGTGPTLANRNIAAGGANGDRNGHYTPPHLLYGLAPPQAAPSAQQAPPPPSIMSGSPAARSGATAAGGMMQALLSPYTNLPQGQAMTLTLLSAPAASTGQSTAGTPMYLTPLPGGYMPFQPSSSLPTVAPGGAASPTMLTANAPQIQPLPQCAPQPSQQQQQPIFIQYTATNTANPQTSAYHTVGGQSPSFLFSHAPPPPPPPPQLSPSAHAAALVHSSQSSSSSMCSLPSAQRTTAPQPLPHWVLGSISSAPASHANELTASALSVSSASSPYGTSHFVDATAALAASQLRMSPPRPAQEPTSATPRTGTSVAVCAPSSAMPYVLVHDPRTGASSVVPLQAVSSLLQFSAAGNSAGSGTNTGGMTSVEQAVSAMSPYPSSQQQQQQPSYATNTHGAAQVAPPVPPMYYYMTSAPSSAPTWMPSTVSNQSGSPEVSAQQLPPHQHVSTASPVPYAQLFQTPSLVPNSGSLSASPPARTETPVQASSHGFQHVHVQSQRTQQAPPRASSSPGSRTPSVLLSGSPMSQSRLPNTQASPTPSPAAAQPPNSGATGRSSFTVRAFN